MKKRFRFRIRNRALVRICAAIAGVMLFALVLLPLFLVAFFHGDETSFPRTERESRTITVYRQNEGKTITLDLESYVAGVVAGEMPATFEMEALKAQAVAARTYWLSKITRAAAGGNSGEHPDAPLCDTTHCQVFRTEEELTEIKGTGWMDDGWLRILEATESTAGEIMYYEGNMVEQPLFHSASGGKTENSEDVFASALPYLRIVESRFEGEAPYQNESISISLSTFEKKIKEKYGATNINPNSIKILSRSDGGRVHEIQVGDKVLTGRDIRELFGLRSANKVVDNKKLTGFKFTGGGYGHGVGMSQNGAKIMATNNYNYGDILTYFFSGVSLKNIYE